MSSSPERPAATGSRFTLTAVVYVPSDEQNDEATVTEELRAALVAAGYHVKWVIASEVTYDEF